MQFAGSQNKHSTGVKDSGLRVVANDLAGGDRQVRTAVLVELGCYDFTPATRSSPGGCLFKPSWIPPNKVFAAGSENILKVGVPDWMILTSKICPSVLVLVAGRQEYLVTRDGRLQPSDPDELRRALPKYFFRFANWSVLVTAE